MALSLYPFVASFKEISLKSDFIQFYSWFNTCIQPRGLKIGAQGQITPKWIIRSDSNSNLFELLCLSTLPASLTKTQSKVTKKKWRHHFFHGWRAGNSKMTGQIRPKFEPVQDFMPVLISFKFDEVWIHSNWEKMATPFSPFKVNGNAQGRITP